MTDWTNVKGRGVVDGREVMGRSEGVTRGDELEWECQCYSGSYRNVQRAPYSAWVRSSNVL